MVKKEFFKVFEKKGSEKAIKRRKLFAKILLIIIIISSISLVGINVFIASSIYGIEVEADGFEQTSPNNQTIIIEGEFLVKNKHWNSVNIRDFTIDFEISTDNDVEIINKTIEENLIPRGETTKIKIEIDFVLLDDLDLEDFTSLINSEELKIEIVISFYYAFYGIKLGFSIKTDLGD